MAPVTGGGGVVNAARTETVVHQTIAPHNHTLAFVFTAVTNFNMTGADAETGFVVGATVGREYDNIMPGLRLEFEGSFRRNNFGLATLAGGGADTDTASSAFNPGGNITHPLSITPLAPLTVVGPGVANAAGAGTYAFQANFVTNFTVADEGNVQTWALMANAWFDLTNDSDFTPYVGGGIGYAISKFDGGAVYDGVDGNFAWQVGAGLNIDVSEDTQIGLGYRYFDAGDVELTLPTPSGTPVSAEQDVRGSSVLLQLTHKL
ncbi:MAG: porin family protein [Alphaproteobacteria bacterium]|nr:porin family protein [Alphaproteobacteria bacterium]